MKSSGSFSGNRRRRQAENALGIATGDEVAVGRGEVQPSEELELLCEDLMPIPPIDCGIRPQKDAPGSECP